MPERSPSSLSSARIPCASGTFEVRATGIAGDSPTCYVHIAGCGPRGSEKAHALYLTHQARAVSRFARDARRVLEGDAWHATIGYGRGSLRVEINEETGNLTVGFRGRRGGIPWSGQFKDERAEDVVIALERVAGHLLGEAVAR